MISKPGPGKTQAPCVAQVNRVASSALLGAAGQLVILHNGREYVLRQTQTGKLILTA